MKLSVAPAHRNAFKLILDRFDLSYVNSRAQTKSLHPRIQPELRLNKFKATCSAVWHNLTGKKLPQHIL